MIICLTEDVRGLVHLRAKFTQRMKRVVCNGNGNIISSNQTFLLAIHQNLILIVPSVSDRSVSEHQYLC